MNCKPSFIKRDPIGLQRLEESGSDSAPLQSVDFIEAIRVRRLTRHLRRGTLPGAVGPDLYANEA